MKPFLSILSLLFIYLLFSSRSCSTQDNATTGMDQKTQNTIDSLKRANDRMSMNLREYENTVYQKLSDFAIYSGIVHDSSLDQQIRDKALKLISGLFIEQDKRVPAFTKNQWTSVPLHEFLGNGIKNDRPMYSFEMSRFTMLEPLRQVNDSVYQGKAGCSLRYLGSPSKAEEINAEVDYFLVRSIRTISRKQLISNTLVLGDFR